MELKSIPSILHPMRINNVRLISNPKKQWAKGIAAQVSGFLEKSGFRVSGGKADLTICIGGDGTILYANHEGNIQGAVLGVGGDKSRICILNRKNWKPRLLRLLRRGRTENRQLLHASIGKKKYTAINDFVLHTLDYRVISLRISTGGKMHEFEGDGLIISSATGSSAYAYSAGGKMLKPRSKKIQAVPIAPYLRAFRPRILPGSAKLEISADRTSAFIVDGIFICNINPGEKITLCSGGPIRFLSK